MTTKKQHREIARLALATIDEIKRRGWVKYTLADTKVFTDRYEQVERTDYDGVTRSYAAPAYITVPEEDCKVCLVGGMSSAYNPYHPTVPGYNRDINDSILDEDYELFLAAVGEMLPAALKKKAAEYAGHKPVRFASMIPTFNDSQATEKPVLELLRRVAKKHAELGAPVKKVAA